LGKYCSDDESLELLESNNFGLNTEPLLYFDVIALPRAKDFYYHSAVCCEPSFPDLAVFSPSF
jgi:hypothetical protein